MYRLPTPAFSGMVDKGDIDTIANQVSKTLNGKRTTTSPSLLLQPSKDCCPQRKSENIQSLDDLIGKKVTCGVGGNETDMLKGDVSQRGNRAYPVETGFSR